MAFPTSPNPGDIYTANDKDTFIWDGRSEEHTSELQSQSDLVCSLLLEKKNKNKKKKKKRNVKRPLFYGPTLQP